MPRFCLFCGDRVTYTGGQVGSLANMGENVYDFEAKCLNPECQAKFDVGLHITKAPKR